MRDEQKQALAERIASILQKEPGVGGGEQIWRAIDEIGKRLDAIESSMTAASPAEALVSQHPSLETYAIPAPDTGEEKSCSFEPHNPVCDHCSMCSSRGF